MLSLIEVTCPHCGAKGQIMLPPVGAIIVGPCPECKGLVVVFCGQVLPLDNQVMLKGTSEQQREHLMDVLTTFLQDRVTDLINEETDKSGMSAVSDAADMAEDDGASVQTPMRTPEALHEEHDSKPHDFTYPTGRNISDDEKRAFVDMELRLLDNKNYFRAIFG
ncbi:MAG: hypothetical protein GWP08_04075 [Nitrospiraceae bacterium]|nr:hypothetical protein [Nitrospiraceae bacterium]